MIQIILLALILIAALAWTARRVWVGLRSAGDTECKPAACKGCPHLQTCSGEEVKNDAPR